MLDKSGRYVTGMHGGALQRLGFFIVSHHSCQDCPNGSIDAFYPQEFLKHGLFQYSCSPYQPVVDQSFGQNCVRNMGHQSSHNAVSSQGFGKFRETVQEEVAGTRVFSGQSYPLV